VWILSGGPVRTQVWLAVLVAIQPDPTRADTRQLSDNFFYERMKDMI